LLPFCDLTELTLDPPEATCDRAGLPLLDEVSLILSPIHSAKGTEWKSVFVLNVVDGYVPSDLGAGTTEELEEERRLLYVAMARAKDDLRLMVPQRFFVHGQSSYGDRHLHASRTRFISEALLPLTDRQYAHFANLIRASPRKVCGIPIRFLEEPKAA
jgi:DNA helicase II / ATP-dependent DNA helicase PcrA